MQIQSRFPEAFRLLADCRFKLQDGIFHDLQTGDKHILPGLNMDAASWEVVSWLLNWLHLSHSRPGFVLRVPIVVIEGPPQCGKGWLLDRLVTIAGCNGIGFHDHNEIPPSLKRLDSMAGSTYPLWVLDCARVLPQRGRRQREVYQERMIATERFLTAELWKTPKGITHTLRTVMVVVGRKVELPEDLKNRAVTIRMEARIEPGRKLQQTLPAPVLASAEWRVLTCVYCGHEFPQGTPAAGSEVLTEHIKVCEKHPMRKLQLERDQLRRALVGLVGADTLDELDAMEAGMRVLPVPEEDRVSTLNAIQALRDTITG